MCRALPVGLEDRSKPLGSSGRTEHVHEFCACAGMFHVKPRRFAEESLSSGFGRRTSRQYMREFILAFDDGMLRCPPGEVSLVPERRIR